MYLIRRVFYSAKINNEVFLLNNYCLTLTTNRNCSRPLLFGRFSFILKALKAYSYFLFSVPLKDEHSDSS